MTGSVSPWLAFWARPDGRPSNSNSAQRTRLISFGASMLLELLKFIERAFGQQSELAGSILSPVIESTMSPE